MIHLNATDKGDPIFDWLSDNSPINREDNKK